MTQPVPKVAAADVERIVRRDFPKRVSDALAILNEYGTDRETAHLTVYVSPCSSSPMGTLNVSELKLKLLNATTATSSPLLNTRIIPNSFLGLIHGASAEVQRIIDVDWKQYQDWFKRP